MKSAVADEHNKAKATTIMTPFIYKHSHQHNLFVILTQTTESNTFGKCGPQFELFNA
jgi:hypothetical protein